VVETERRGDQVDEVIHVVDRLPQRVAELLGGDVLESGERRTAGGDRVDVAQQPVRWELQAPSNAPPIEVRTHHRSSLRPVRTDPRQRQITPGELGAPGVDPVEDVDDDVHRLVGAGDRLDVDLAVEHVAEAVEAVDEVEEPRMAVQPGRHRGGSTGEQGGDVDPERVVLHLDRAVELERLGLDVEPQVAERLRVALEEGGRRAADDAVQRGDALLAVQQQRTGAARRRRTTHRLARGVGLPHQQRADRVTLVQRAHQAAHLIAVPDVAALELGQEHRSGVNLIEDRAELGHAGTVSPHPLPARPLIERNATGSGYPQWIALCARTRRTSVIHLSGYVPVIDMLDRACAALVALAADPASSDHCVPGSAQA
jgi:hypothetical protein